MTSARCRGLKPSLLLALVIGCAVAEPAAAQSPLTITSSSPLPSGNQGSFYSFTFTATGGVTPYSWSIFSGALPPGLLLSTTGVLSGTPTSTGNYSFGVLVTGGTQRNTKNFTLAINPPIVVTVSPPRVTLSAGQSQQFTATVTGTTNTAVTWSISPSGAGSVSTGGLYTAPANIASAQTVTVTATSVADPTKSGSATVTLSPTIAVTVSPSSVTLSAGQSQQFTATVTGTTYTAVTWSISPSGAGSVSTSGLYTTPAGIALAQTVTVTATSVADPSKSGTATVTLSPTIAVTVSPPSVTLSAGQRQQFTATVTGTTYTAVTWSISPSGAGSVSTSGLYTAPAGIVSAQTVTVTATSVADPSKSGTATVTLSPTIAVTVSPPSVTLSAGQSQQFTATVTGTTYTAVTWSISPSGVGSISSSGLYTAPAGIVSAQTVTVAATSVADPTKSGSATVTLSPTIAVTVSPPSVTLSAGQSQQFTATVTGTTNTAVTWSISPSGVGSISSSGLYTAPAGIVSAQTVTVTATSVADKSRSGTASITLSPAPPPSLISLGLNPTSVTGGQPSTGTLTLSGPAASATNVALSSTDARVVTVPASVVIPAGATSADFAITTLPVGSNVDVTVSASYSGVTETAALTVTALSGRVVLNVPDPVAPGEQPSAAIELQGEYSTPITGQMTLTFNSDAVDKADHLNNVHFVNGLRTFDFTIADKSAPMPSIPFTSGTVAGTITLTVRLLQVGGVALTQPTTFSRSIVVNRLPPAITRVCLARTSSGFDAVVIAYSTPREILNTTFSFTPAPGVDLQTKELSPPSARDALAGWYQSEASKEYGSMFRLVQSFLIQPNMDAIQSVSIRLANQIGDSETKIANFEGNCPN